MPPDPPTMAQTYKSYKAPGIRPPIFHEVSCECNSISLGIYLNITQVATETWLEKN